MRICFVGLDCLPLLSARFAADAVSAASAQQMLLARALARRGHDVSLVVADRGQADGAQWDRIRTFKAQRPAAGLPLLRLVHPRGTALWSALARAAADLYYASDGGAPLALLALFCAQRGKRFVVRAARDDAGRSALERRAQAFALRRAAAILVPGAAQALALRRELGLPSRVAGALLEAAAPAPRRDIDLLWVGTVHSAQRADRVVTLARRLPQARVHMVAAPAPGEEALFRVIRSMAESVANLTFHAPLAPAAECALFARARLLLDAADDAHRPHAHLQAWAHGVPVAALTDADGTLLREGLGVVAAAPHRLLDAARRLLDDAAAWQAMSVRCQAYAAREHGEERVLRAYLAAFDDVLRGRVPAAGTPPEPLHA